MLKNYYYSFPYYFFPSHREPLKRGQRAACGCGAAGWLLLHQGYQLKGLKVCCFSAVLFVPFVFANSREMVHHRHIQFLTIIGSCDKMLFKRYDPHWPKGGALICPKFHTDMTLFDTQIQLNVLYKKASRTKTVGLSKYFTILNFFVRYIFGISS